MKYKTFMWLSLVSTQILFSSNLLAETGIPILSVETNDSGNQEYSVTLQVLGLMTLLTFIPAS